MPHNIVKTWPARLDDQNDRLAERITGEALSILDDSQKSWPASLENVPPPHWAEAVYEPDFLGDLGKLSRRVGDPL
ncbi:tautomerase family protein [Singulisphaera rosea]